MPQIDFFILNSQINFLLFFFIGYLFFVKYILTYFAYVYKMNHEIYIKSLEWFSKLDRYIYPYNITFINGNMFNRMYYQSFRQLLKKTFRKNLPFFTFGLYFHDYIYLRNLKLRQD